MTTLEHWRELRRMDGCYLVWDEISREGALFDISPDLEPIFKIIETESVNLRHVFLTQPAEIEPLRARFPKLLLHTSAKGALPQHRNRPNDFIHLGSLRITNRGYGEEGVIYIIGNWPEDAPHVVMLGDLERIPKEAMHEKVLTLPPDTLLCPAKGPLTTVAAVREGV